MADPVSFEDYQLAQNNPDSFVVQHPDGSQFTIAKDGLDPDYVSHVEQNMPAAQSQPSAADVYAQTHAAFNPVASGSTWKNINNFGRSENTVDKLVPFDPAKFANVDERDAYVANLRKAGIPLDGASPGAAQPSNQVASNGNGPLGVVPGTLPPSQPQGMPDPNAAASAPPQAGQIPGVNYGNMNDPMSMINAGYQNQVAGLGGQYNVATEIGKQSAAALQAEQEYMAHVQAERDSRMQDMYARNMTLSNQIANGEVDPNRYWNNMSTGQTIGNAIALIAGGLSQGLTGKNNPALDIINNAVKNDIDAQKHNLENKRSLLGMNLEQSRNIDEAASHAFINAHAIVNGQIQKAIAETANPAAKSALQLALAPVQQSMGSQIMQHQIMYGPSGNGTNQQVSQNGIPNNLALRISYMPKELQAPLLDEAKSLAASHSAKMALTNIVARMKQLNTVGGLTSPAAWRENEELQSAFIETLQKMNGGTRPSEEMRKLAKPFFGTTLKTAPEYDKTLSNVLQQADVDHPPPPLMTSLGWVGQPRQGGNAQAIAARQAQTQSKVAQNAKR